MRRGLNKQIAYATLEQFESPAGCYRRCTEQRDEEETEQPGR